MACHGHSNSCPGHAGYIPGLPPLSWTDDPEIKSVHFNEIRTAITDELARRSISGGTNPAEREPDWVVYSLHYKQLRDRIDDAKAWSWPTEMGDIYFQADDEVLELQTEQMQDRIDDIRSDCVCDCAYSCTCNCNYCTCNCNYCTCDCNYSCTCNCDYCKSDCTQK